jgi:hypothetical protein
VLRVGCRLFTRQSGFLLPVCGEKVAMRGPAQTRREAPHPALRCESPRKSGELETPRQSRPRPRAKPPRPTITGRADGARDLPASRGLIFQQCLDQTTGRIIPAVRYSSNALTGGGRWRRPHSLRATGSFISLASAYCFSTERRPDQWTARNESPATPSAKFAPACASTDSGCSEIDRCEPPIKAFAPTPPPNETLPLAPTYVPANAPW